MKKYIYYSILSLLFCSLHSCQNDIEEENIGYLRVAVGTTGSTSPKTKIATDYDPKQLHVEIVNQSGSVVEQTDDYSLWETEGKVFTLRAGSYTIKASSYNFDGSESGWEIPYYVGSTTVDVVKGASVTADITCFLANVKVSVNMDASLDVFQSKVVTIESALAQQRLFEEGEVRAAYFPVGDLKASFTAINSANVSHTHVREITNVKARDHYIFNYRLAESGSGSIKVEADDVENTYIYTIEVPTVSSTKLEVTAPNAWSNFAYLEGGIVSSKEPLDNTKIFFEWQPKGGSSWNTLAATSTGTDRFVATLSGLTPDTEYSCRLVYRSSDEETISNTLGFVTETQNKVPNLSFDDWHTTGGSKATWYPCSDLDYEAGKLFWDSGNGGANTLNSVNPTSPEETDVVSGKAIKMASKVVDAGIMKAFAAGNVYSGEFLSSVISISNPGAKLNFGREFAERPSKLVGYYKYNPGIINNIKTDKVSAVKEGDRDLCSIYILLADWTAPFAVNTQTSTFVDFSDSSIIAYGELDAAKTSPESMSEYERFEIDLKYRDLNRKPSYILIVCSASKYGDYFTGSDSSVLLIDEMDLIYEEPVTDPAYIN